MRGVTSRPTEIVSVWDTISTRTPHAGSDPGPAHRARDAGISTRTPHAGSDGMRTAFIAL